jgi:hypothetical protein
VVAAFVGVLTAILLVATLGLLPGDQPVGAGDNGDGARLFCGVGLTPVGAPASNWQGGVVLDFARSAPCSSAQPSSALAIMKVAAANQDPFSLERLGWLYVTLFAAVSGVAAWAATGRRYTGLWLLVPPLLPLLDPDFARFVISTYSEPAGLLGAFAMLCGLAVAMATDRELLAEHLTAVALIGGGGLLAATAKIGYAPLVLVAIVLVAGVPVRLTRSSTRWAAWTAGPAVAVLVAVGALATAPTVMGWQDDLNAVVNTHNLIYTVVLTEIPGSAVRLGLPAGADDFAGQAYFPNGPEGVMGAEQIAEDPDRFRNRGWNLLLRSPTSLAASIGVGLQATKGRAVTYLPSEPWAPDSIAPTIGVTISGEQGADAASLRSWLDDMSLPWFPSFLVLLGMMAGLASLKWRGRSMTGFARLAGVSAVCGLGLAMVAVLGDGYFEIAKHVWLAAYFIDVTMLALLGMLVALALPRSMGQQGSDPSCPTGTTGV